MKTRQFPDDEPADIDFVMVDEPAEPLPPPELGPGVGLRWCVTAAAVSVVLLLAAVFAFYQRSQPIVTRTSATQGQATQNLTGCPVISRCGNSDNVRPSVAIVAQQYLPGASQLWLDSTYDGSAGTDFRSIAVLRTPDGVIVWIVAGYDPRGTAISPRSSELPDTGPAEITLVRPGYYTPGTSLAIIAQVPAGVTVPALALRRLAADPSLQLEP